MVFTLSCLVSFSHWTYFSSYSVLWMTPRRETATSRAQGKRPAESSQPEQTEARRKARYDTTLFSSVKDYQLYKQKFSQKKVVPRRRINFSQLQHFGFEGLFSRMGWAFYSPVTYGLRELVMSMVRGVEIRLSLKSICCILDIPSVGL